MSNFKPLAILALTLFIGSLFLDSANGYIGQDCKNSTCGHCQICLLVVEGFDLRNGQWLCQAGCLHPGDDCGSDLQCLSGANNTKCSLKSTYPYFQKECDCISGFTLNKKYNKCVQGDYCEVDNDCRPGATCSSDNNCVGETPMTNCTVDADCGNVNRTICDTPFAHSSKFCLRAKVGVRGFCDVDRQCTNQDRYSSCLPDDDKDITGHLIHQSCKCRSGLYKYLARDDRCVYFDFCEQDTDCSSDQECNNFGKCIEKTPMSSSTIGMIVGGSIIGVGALIAGFFVVKALRAQERVWEQANERTRIVNLN